MIELLTFIAGLIVGITLMVILVHLATRNALRNRR
jgi:hypothetical protein